MKIFVKSNHLWRHGHGISGVLRALLFSSNTMTSPSPSSSTIYTSSSPMDSLYRRISQSGNPKVSVIPVIEQWLEEGNEIKFSRFQSFIKVLRKHRRFAHALQMSEWMSDERGYNMSIGDIAIRLDLVSKVHGVEQAEKYFNSIHDSKKGFELYGALLYSYSSHRCLDKAEATFQKMKDLGFVKTSLPFNVMLQLYARMGEHKKLEILLQEMETSGISCDNYTFNIKLNAYAATANIEEMVKFLKKIEADPAVKIDWHAYVVAANGYLKAGLTDEASQMLKRSEHLVEGKSRRYAYEIFLTLYTAAGKKDEVYRIWGLYRSIGRSLNSGYLTMISSLMKLDDMDGAESIAEKWLSGGTLFDHRIPNTIIGAYLGKGLWEKAEAFVNKILETGNKLEASTWDRLATTYHVGGQMAKAVETIKKAISASKPGWKPNIYTLAACLEYLKHQGDVDTAEELLKIIGERCHFPEHIYDRLMNNVNNGKPSQMEGEVESINGEKHAVMELDDKSCTGV